nr:MAG TPA: hypothetical protein [Caudoviricetes sp.]
MLTPEGSVLLKFVIPVAVGAASLSIFTISVSIS